MALEAWRTAGSFTHGLVALSRSVWQDGTRSVHARKLSEYVSGAVLVAGDRAALRLGCVIGNWKQLISIHTCSGLPLPEAWTGRSGGPEEVRPSALPSLSLALWGKLSLSLGPQIGT